MEPGLPSSSEISLPYVSIFGHMQWTLWGLACQVGAMHCALLLGVPFPQHLRGSCGAVVGVGEGGGGGGRQRGGGEACNCSP